MNYVTIMGLSKKDNFTDKELELAELAKALAHPARIAILQFLLKSESCICTDIVEVIPLAQSTVSQHLKVLKKVGILKGSIDGATICYCIDSAVWEKSKVIFQAFFTDLIQCNDSKCC